MDIVVGALRWKLTFALLLIIMLAGCTATTGEPYLTVIDNQSAPSTIQVELANVASEGTLTASFTDFKLVDPQGTISQPTSDTRQHATPFPSNVEIGPGENARGALVFGTQAGGYSTYTITWNGTEASASATVHVSEGGYTETGEKAPSAIFRFVKCEPSDEAVTVRLSSGGPIQMDKSQIILYNRTNDVEETRTNPIAGSGEWNEGEHITIAEESSTGADGHWDDSLTNGLRDGNPYRLDFVHNPSESTYSSLPFTC